MMRRFSYLYAEDKSSEIQETANNDNENAVSLSAYMDRKINL